jgi:hypothetical protein
MSWEELGAILTGIGSVISALVSLRITRKRMKKECDERVQEVKTAMLEMKSQ